MKQEDRQFNVTVRGCIGEMRDIQEVLQHDLECLYGREYIHVTVALNATQPLTLRDVVELLKLVSDRHNEVGDVSLACCIALGHLRNRLIDADPTASILLTASIKEN